MRTGKTKSGVNIKSTEGMKSSAPFTLWVLVANNAGAHLFEQKNHKGPIVMVQEIPHPTGREAGHLLVSDHPGRAFDSHTESHGGHQSGGARHSFSSPEDPKTHESQLWADHLAELLQAGLANYDALVLVSESRFAGRLNSHLSAAVRSRIHRTVEKDLGWLAPAELQARLDKIVSETE